MTRVLTGMRRPSWNKSQAIQQVISLKALLEPTDHDSGDGGLRKPVVLLSPVRLPRLCHCPFGCRVNLGNLDGKSHI